MEFSKVGAGFILISKSFKSGNVRAHHREHSDSTTKSIHDLVLNPSFMFQGKRVALQVLDPASMSKIELFLGIEMAKGVVIRVNDELLQQ